MYREAERLLLPCGELLLRPAGEEDAALLLQYLKTVSSESRFLTREPEEISLSEEEERRFIRRQRESDTDLMLLGFLGQEHVGTCSLSGLPTLRCRHRAVVAIALYQRYTGMGLGRAMLKRICEIAREKGFEQLELEVVAGNRPAIALYRALGFETFGTLPHNMKYPDGSYADACWMMKRL